MIRKTAREKLARFAEKYKLSRDAFVEHAVHFENESITKRAEEKRRTHTRALEIVKSSSTALENALEELKGFLDEGDPIRGRFLTFCIVIDNLCQEIEKELQDASPRPSLELLFYSRNHHCKHLAASEDKRLSGLGPAEEQEVELPHPASLVLHESTLQTYSVQKYSCEIGV